jgi:hypothetical protein
MTFVVTTYVPEGIIQASDSRQFISAKGTGPDGKQLNVETINSDNVFKTALLTRAGDNDKPLFEVGVNTFGEDLLKKVPIASHLRKFAEEELTDNDDVTTIPRKVVDYFRREFPNADTGFQVAGYKKEERVSVPHVYSCHVKNNSVERANAEQNGDLRYGALWSGQGDIIASILNESLVMGPNNQPVPVPKPPIFWDAMALQDAIDFSIYAVRTTIDTMRFQARQKNVGGPIDALLITPDGAVWIQRKTMRGE